MKEAIMNELKKVIDPEIGLNIVDMDMIKDVVIENNNVTIKFKPTSPFCPMIDYLVKSIEQAAKKVKNVKSIKVEVIKD